MTSTVCWQFRVKQRKAREDHHPPSIIGLPAHVAGIAQGEARKFISQYEWLGNAGTARFCYGLKYGDNLAAVVCYTRPTSNAAFASLLGVNPTLVFQLCRGASTHWAPKYAASMLISRSLKMLELRTSAKLVVAYADPAAGEVGTVYQATNATYIGLSDSRGPGAYVIQGVRYHPRSVHRLFGSARHDALVAIDPRYERIQRTKKHRYVYVLGSEIEKRRLMKFLQPRICQYPKRVQTDSVQATNSSSPRRSAVRSHEAA
jgi:hypothetical protein